MMKGIPSYGEPHYNKQKVEEQLIELYKLNNGRLKLPELEIISKHDKEFPSVATIKRYYKTTAFLDIWIKIEEKIGYRARKNR